MFSSEQKQNSELPHVNCNTSLPVFFEESPRGIFTRVRMCSKVNNTTYSPYRHNSGSFLDHWPTPKAGSKRPIERVFPRVQLWNSYIAVGILAPVGHTASSNLRYP